MSQQDSLKYSKEHEWILIEGNVATIGITDYATEQLGDVVHVDLPDIEDEFEKDSSCSTVESVKSVSDIYMPVSGKVLAVNELLSENPAIINEDPFAEGWLLKIEMSVPSEVDELLSSDQYKAFLAEES